MKEATEVTRTRKNGNENRSESLSPDILKKKSVYYQNLVGVQKGQRGSTIICNSLVQTISEEN